MTAPSKRLARDERSPRDRAAFVSAPIRSTVARHLRSRKVQATCLMALAGLSTVLALSFSGAELDVPTLEFVVRALQTEPALGLGLLFAFWFALFLTFAPLGSLSVVLAGFVFGPFAGFLQYLAQAASSLCLYELLGRPCSESLVSRLSEHPRTRRAAHLLARLHDHPVLAAATLRLVPFVPSCICVLSCHTLGIRLKSMMISTLLVGWIRPLSLAWAGSRLPDLSTFVQEHLL